MKHFFFFNLKAFFAQSIRKLCLLTKMYIIIILKCYALKIQKYNLQCNISIDKINYAFFKT